MPLQRTAALLAALMIAAPACGSDDPDTTTSVEMTPAAGSMEPHAHDGEAVTLTEWPADRDLPTIAVTTEPTDDGTVVVSFAVTGFTVRGGDPEDVIEGAGHLHVSVDGREMGMAFEPEMTLYPLEPGTHELVLQLASGEHDFYAHDGEALTYTATFEVAGEVTEPDQVIELSVDEGGVVGGIVEASASVGNLVEIRVDSTITEELHLHVYDVTADLEPGETATLRFRADIPGVFEAELEGSGLQVLSLTVS